MIPKHRDELNRIVIPKNSWIRGKIILKFNYTQRVNLQIMQTTLWGGFLFSGT